MDEYQIIDGVRRARAAQLAGHNVIPAHVLSPQGTIEATIDVPLDSLWSPKATVQRITAADEYRWQRAVQGARRSILPFPPIIIQRGNRGTMLSAVDFDVGAGP